LKFKMKEMYIIYNEFTNAYSFVNGPNPYKEKCQRSLGGSKGLIEKIKYCVNDAKRKTLLHLQDVPEQVVLDITKLFKKDKMKEITAEAEVEKDALKAHVSEIQKS